MSATKPRFFADADSFRRWLMQHGASETELVVGYWKVDSGRPSMSWSESVDEALCFGWIDGVRKRIDEQSYQIRFTPRRPQSIWSAVNIAKIEQLRAAGRMTEAGERAFNTRQAHRSKVYAYEQAEPSTLNNTELSQFQDQKAAWSYFESCPPSYRQVTLHWITSAKKPDTRAHRLRQLIAACASKTRLR